MNQESSPEAVVKGKVLDSPLVAGSPTKMKQQLDSPITAPDSPRPSAL